MSGELIMRIVYGINVESENDPYIEIAETAIKSTIAGNAGTYLGTHHPLTLVEGGSYKACDSGRFTNL